MRCLPTRVLHLILALAVVHQLVSSWFTESPRAGAPGSAAFQLHETVGLASLAVLAAFWVWTLVRRREAGIGALVPWFSAARRRAVIADLGVHLKSIARFTLPRSEAGTPLASAVHGLGLLTATGMAISGALVYMAIGADGLLSAAGKAILGVHEALANLMWTYLIAHTALAVIHQTAGHEVLERMFSAPLRMKGARQTVTMSDRRE